MLMYQVYAGYFTVSALVGFIIPYAFGAPVRRRHAFIAGLCLALVFFCAFSFCLLIVFAALLCLVKYIYSVNRRNDLELLLWGVLGAVAGTVMVLLWLTIYGDIIGYAVDHIYFNMIFYTHYLGFSPKHMFRLAVPGLPWLVYPHSWYTHFLFAIPSIVCALAACWAYNKQLYGKAAYRYAVLGLLLLLTLIATDPRLSIDFAASTIGLVALGVAALISAKILEDRQALPPLLVKTDIIILLVMLAAGITAQFTVKTWLYQWSAIDYYKHKGIIKAAKTDEMKFLHSIVGPDESVQQYPFSLNFYVEADRLPAFGVFYWMPWQNDYAKSPVKGYDFDACRDMRTAPPKIVYYMPMDIWGNAPESFMGCVIDILHKKYLQTTRMENLWIRADVAADRPDILQSAIVPERYDAGWLTLERAQKIDAVKLSYKLFASLDDKTCLGELNGDNQALSVVDCSDPKALKLALHKAGERLELLMHPRNQCIETQKQLSPAGAPVRAWPCTDSPGQAVEVLGGGKDFKLKFLDSGLCLATANGTIIEDDCASASSWGFLP
jgi:hypothetical protein